MKKFIFIFCFFSTIFLFSLSVSAYTFTADFSNSENLPDFSSWTFGNCRNLPYFSFTQSGQGVLFIDPELGDVPYVLVPIGSMFSFIDGSNLSFTVTVTGAVPTSRGGEFSFWLQDTSDIYKNNFHTESHTELHFANNDSTFSTFTFDIPFNLSNFTSGDGFVYLGFDYNPFYYESEGNWPYIELASISVSDGFVGGLGDVTLQESSSFSDLQYIVDLLKSFFFGGTVSDPDTGDSFSFGEDGSGGIMNFVVYSSGGTNFALWHLLVAVAVIGLGISFVIRLAGNFGRAPDNVAQSLHGDDE